ncbi:formate dehydrogenase subunit gamma [Gammaproteobacteria bacterium]|nr:formate dehydrogenase subunit gamma [Gammaproteobacteria bacterium]
MVIRKRPNPALTVMMLGLAIGMFLLLHPLPSEAESSESASRIQVPNPASDLWRDVRNRTATATDPELRKVPTQVLVHDLWQQVQGGKSDITGRTQSQGVDAGVLINTQGEQWRNFRMQTLVPYGGYLLAGVLSIIILFYVVRGRIGIEGGRSGIKVLRFSISQRTVHWVVATTFVLLAITGIILLFGRFTLKPLLGGELFSFVATATKTIHDYVGPVFGVALVTQFFLFVRGNLPSFKVDLAWILKGGGMFGGHASSHCYNAGEKMWFWLAMLGGLLVVATGLVLDFPIFGQGRGVMGFAHVVHTISAVVILAVALGHIYMGTIAVEGAFEGMATGYCDANWAKEHHDLWYEKTAARSKEETPSNP